MGIVASLFTESFPPKSHFSVDDIPDLTGKVVIVTGANTGIGKETAKALLSHNAKVYIAARSKSKAEQAIEDLKKDTGKDAIFLQLDLADLKSVKASAEEFLSKEKELHVLFNNAGVMQPPINQVTVQGYDLQFGTNVLGHFYFTKLLMPALLEGAKSSPDGKTRVVNTSSAMSLIGSLNFNILKDGPTRKKQFVALLYSQSKLGEFQKQTYSPVKCPDYRHCQGNILFSNELSRRYGDQGIVSTSLNPGNISTDLQRHMLLFQRILLKPILYPASYGALTQLWAGTSKEDLDFNGKYLIPWARVGTGNPLGRDTQLAGELWSWLEEQVQDV